MAGRGPLLDQSQADERYGGPTSAVTLDTAQTITGSKTFTADTLFRSGRPWVDVRAYGAVGDGTTDDSTAIQAAEDAAASAGGIVFFPPGTYIAAGLTKKSLTHWLGAGISATVLKLKNAANTFLVEGENFSTLTGGNTTGGIFNWSISDITFDGNKAGQTSGTQDLLRFYAYNYRLSDLIIRNARNRGLYSEWSTQFLASNDSMESHLRNIKIRDCEGGGVAWYGPHDSVWFGGQVFYCGTIAAPKVAVDFGVGSAGTRLYGVHTWANPYHTYGFRIQNSSGNSASVALIDCESEGSTVAQVLILDNDVVIEGGQYFASGAATPVGIEIGGATNSPVGTKVNTKVLNCTSGSLKATNDGGGTMAFLSIYQATGEPVTGALAANSFVVALVAGQAGKSVIRGMLPLDAGGVLQIGDSSTGVRITRNAANQFRFDGGIFIARTAANAVELWDGAGTIQIQMDTANKQWNFLSGVLMRFWSDVFATEKARINAANGLFQAGDGDVGNPGLAFFSDADTGLFRQAPNTLGVAIGGNEGARLAEPADGETALLVRRNVGGTLSIQRVSMGATDSGGAGFKVLRVPN